MGKDISWLVKKNIFTITSLNGCRPNGHDTLPHGHPGLFEPERGIAGKRRRGDSVEVNDAK